MALDKVVDSAQLDGALTATADAIRGKTGGTEQIAWDAGKGFADAVAAIAAGGGGTLAVNSGTITLARSYTVLNIPHGCGKLPLAVFLYPASDYEYGTINLLSGVMWHRESFCLLTRTGVSNMFNTMMKPYYVADGAPDANSPSVDAEKIYCNPPAQWLAATYEWTAIYEV